MERRKGNKNYKMKGKKIMRELNRKKLRKED